jgi:hypothetical protein
VPGSINTNLDQAQIAAVVGVDNLRKLREADGERRKSEHRGSWVASRFERWRSAIENYVSSVKPGNQTALNTAQVRFASYLNGLHNSVHPIFAASFLDSLDGLPADGPRQVVISCSSLPRRYPAMFPSGHADLRHFP